MDSEIATSSRVLYSGTVSDLPTQIGPYRVRRLLGEGGMGVVYLADREVEGIKIRAAVKVLRAHLAGGDIARRFAFERRLLGSLTCSGIARLLDAGQTGDGRPYFAMEYVDGLSILQYCDRSRLSLQGRLMLFLKVCHTVQSAHEALVLHRDIKPANILVGGDGMPRLLDFGIAKILHSGVSEALDAPTESFVRCLTPEYASPEQVLGEPLSVASDVYSLGVVLSELMCGRRPHDLPSRDDAEIRRTVCDSPAKRLSEHVKLLQRSADGALDRVAESRGTNARECARFMTGPINDVVATSLARYPHQRYASVATFVADIQRVLDGETVITPLASSTYRLQSAFRRHARVAATVLALFLSGVAASLFVREQARSEALQRWMATATVKIRQAMSAANPEVHIERLSGHLSDFPADCRGRATASMAIKEVERARDWCISRASDQARTQRMIFQPEAIDEKVSPSIRQ